MNNEILISAVNIRKKYRALTAVEDVSIDVYPGKIYGVAGLNGAGKSTLLAVLAGVTRPDGGAVWYRGGTRAVHTPRKMKKSPGSLRIGYVPQDVALFPELSVYDNLKFWALASDSSHGQFLASDSSHGLKRRILSSAGSVGLSGELRRPVRVLSGGMKQRANIAAALVTGPDVLIMDEPTAGLDVKNRRDIINTIGSLVRTSGAGLAVICTSHQPGELEMVSNRLLLLDRGRVVFDGAPSDVFHGKYANYANMDDILYSLA